MSAIELEIPEQSTLEQEEQPSPRKAGLIKRLRTRPRRWGPKDPWLRKLWLIGLALLALQLVAMATWSTILWSHFSLTMDYSTYHQAWWLISRGHLDPRSTFFINGHYFWQNNFELIMWPLAMLGVIFPHGPVLGILQDTSLFGTELVIWAWMLETIGKVSATATRQIVGITGIVLLLGNPWTWTSISFDFHMEVVGVFFVVLAAWELSHGRRMGWIFVFLALLSGNPSAAWVVGLGLGLLLAQRKRWQQGVGVMVMGVAYLGISAIVHGDLGGNPIGLYGYLAGSHLVKDKSLADLITGIITHPNNIAKALWAHRADTWANLAPGGFIGILNPITLGVGLVDIGTVDLTHGNMFSQPLFQNVDLYVLIPLGTIVVLSWLSKRIPKLTYGVGVILMANAIVWSTLFIPHIFSTWLRVDSSSAAVLARVDGEIPPTAEVVASQGIVGRFTDRKTTYGISSPSEVIPIKERDIWWIITPRHGIETDTSANQDALIAKLATTPGTRLVVHSHGIWAFNWIVPPGTKTVTIPPNPTGLPAWLLTGRAARPYIKGPASTWAAQGTGRAGYVISSDYFRMKPGNYQALVTLSTTVPVTIQVWNDTGNVLLTQRYLPSTNGYRTITLPVRATRRYIPRIFSGWGPFHVGVVPRPRGQRLEIRVWTPGKGIVRVTWVQFKKEGNSHAT